MAKKSTYKAKDIEVLEGLEPVRKRPGMYIGSTNQDIKKGTFLFHQLTVCMMSEQRWL